MRDVDLPGGAGMLALITLDNGLDHTKPNTFGPAGLLELNDALDQAARRTDLAAVGVTGKPFIFAVGADLNGVAVIRDHDQAKAIAQLGHAVFRRLGELDIPSFAFVNGAAMGGGVEVALHCTYRTISPASPAVALPECFLGLVPGWGGTYLLPRLIGPAQALKIIVENALSQNKMLRGPQAFELGLADAMFSPADFLEESLRWAGAGADRRRDGRTGPVPEQTKEEWDAAVARGPVLHRRQAARGRTRALPGPGPGRRGPDREPGRRLRRRGRGPGRPDHER